MRAAMEQTLPMIWFQGVGPGLYLPVYPVFLADEEPERSTVRRRSRQSIASTSTRSGAPGPLLGSKLRREVVKERLHQRMFRERVLLAYQNRCSICRLRHIRLLDAAHVLADSDGGEPVVTNGIAMCKSTMRLMTQTYSASLRTIGLECGPTSWMSWMVRLCVTHFRP